MKGEPTKKAAAAMRMEWESHASGALPPSRSSQASGTIKAAGAAVYWVEHAAPTSAAEEYSQPRAPAD